MDSYDFYNLYLNNPQQFTKIFVKLNGNDEKFDEILKAVKILAQKSKIKNLKIFSGKIIKLILEDESQSNFKLDEVLEELKISEETIENLLNEKSQLEVNKLRIFKIYLKKNETNVEEISENSIKILEILIFELFRESSISHYVAGLLKIASKNSKIENFIVTKIFNNCQDFSSLSLQNLCYFFDKICELNLVEKDNHELILKYFENPSKLSKKQAIFIIKTLITFDLLSSVENFKIFIIILEALDESPSHIILPTLELIRQVKNDENFHKFFFILCCAIIDHENTQVKLWGLNFVLNLDQKFNKSEVIEILKGLNSTLLYEDGEFVKNIKKFIWNNFEEVFGALIDVPWSSVAFYNVLEAIVQHVMKMDQFCTTFLVNMQKQAEMIPKKIKNVEIREGVQVCGDF